MPKEINFNTVYWVLYLQCAGYSRQFKTAGSKNTELNWTHNQPCILGRHSSFSHVAPL